MADDDDDDFNTRSLPMATRMQFVERDVRSHARTITRLIDDGNDARVADATRIEQDVQRDKRLASIETLGRWALAGIGAAVIAQFVQLAFSGFFHVAGGG